MVAVRLVVGWLMLLWWPFASAEGTSDLVQINALLDGLHHDAAEADFDSYFDRYTDDAFFLGTDKRERWSVDAFKAYAKPNFDSGRGWTYHPVERFVMGDGDTRWFDEVLVSEKYGHCRGTGVVVRVDGSWKIAHYSLSFLIPNEAAAAATALAIEAETKAEK